MTRPFVIAPNDPRGAQGLLEQLNAPAHVERSVVTPLYDSYEGRSLAGLVAVDSLGAIQPDYCCGATTSAAMTTMLLTFGSANLRAVPFWHDNGFRIHQIGIEVATAAGAGGKARYAIYKSRDDRAGDLRPGELVWGSAEVDTTSSGGKATSALTIDLEPGRMYWAAVVSGTATPILRALSVGTTGPMMGGSLGIVTPPGSTLSTHLQGTWTYGAFPAFFPGVTMTATTTAPPAVFVSYTRTNQTTLVRRVPAWSPGLEGFTLKRVALLGGRSIPRNTPDRPTIKVRPGVRTGGKFGALGAFDSRTGALGLGVPLTVWRGRETLPAESMLEVEVSQVGWPRVSCADVAVQWDLSYTGA